MNTDQVHLAASLETARADRELLDALGELLASKTNDPNKGRSHAGRWTTINARTETLNAVRAAFAKALSGVSK